MSVVGIMSITLFYCFFGVEMIIFRRKVSFLYEECSFFFLFREKSSEFGLKKEPKNSSKKLKKHGIFQKREKMTSFDS